MGKRYYYDAKGRYRGKSSDKFIADGKTYKMLAIVAAIAIAWNLVFGDSEKKKTEAPTAKSSAVVEAEAASPAIITRPVKETRESKEEQDSGAKNVTSAGSEATSSPGKIRHESTEEYMQKNYVNGDSRCPKDIVDFHKMRCNEGDETSCAAARCGERP